MIMPGHERRPAPEPKPNHSKTEQKPVEKKVDQKEPETKVPEKKQVEDDEKFWRH